MTPRRTGFEDGVHSELVGVAATDARLTPVRVNDSPAR